jgi:protein SCO1
MNTWARRVVVSALVAVMVVSTAMLVFLWRSERRGAEERAEHYAFAPRDGGELPRLWRAPSFSLTDQRGRPFTMDSLRGQPAVLDFIYTQCTSACPILTSRMVVLARALAGVDVRFVSISVDPAHDTPEALAAYAARWDESEARWTLLATTDASLADVAAGFRVTTEKVNDEKNPILHTNLFFLVDGEGVVRGVYRSEVAEAMSDLAADVRALARAAPPSDAGAAGLTMGLYASLGCPGCHENPRIAPPLVDLAGAERTLENGEKVTVDDAYLRRAILEPGAQIVAGYPSLMPSYRHYLTNAQVDALVAELDGRTSAGAARPDAPVRLAVDPVCRMKVRAVPQAPHLTWHGEDLHFCSESCKSEFEAHPDEYPHGHGPEGGPGGDR